MNGQMWCVKAELAFKKSLLYHVIYANKVRESN